MLSCSLSQARYLQHSQSVNTGRHKREHLATTQRHDTTGRTRGVSRAGRAAARRFVSGRSGGSSSNDNPKALAGIQKRGVGHQIAELGALLGNLGLELGDLLRGVVFIELLTLQGESTSQLKVFSLSSLTVLRW